MAHEALLRKWPLLRGWLDEEREFLIGKDQLEQDLLDWEKAPADQKNDALLSGLKLTRARTWLVAKPLQLSEDERAFIQASVAHHEMEATQRERFRRRVQQGIMAAAVVLAIVAAGAIWEWRDAKAQTAQAESRRLAATALLHRGDELDLPSLLSVEALRSAGTFESYNALFTVFETNPRLWTYFYHPDEVRSVIFSPDGKTLASMCDDGTVRLWDVTTRSLLGEPLKGLSAAFSPDGKMLALASVRSGEVTLEFWDVATRKPLGEPLKGYFSGVSSVTFSPDGKRVAVASKISDKSVVPVTVQLWDVASRQPLGEPLKRSFSNETTLTFSPDGKSLAVASDS